MKKWTTCIYLAALLLSSTSLAWSGWQLYDDFSSGSIDTQKWEIDDSSATITVEGGRVKIVHQSGFPSDNSWISFKNPTRITGIKATISVESQAGDARVRIGGFIGKIDDDYMWLAHEIRTNQTYINSQLAILGPAPDHDFDYTIFWGYFTNPITLIGQTFTMSTVFGRKQAAFAVQGQGEMQFDFPVSLTPTDDPFKGIGTRSQDGSGTCVVYIDDVFITRDTNLTPVNMLLLD